MMSVEQEWCNFEPDTESDLSDIMWRQEMWESGFHVTASNKKIKISSMTTPHLLNTIRYFERDYDVSALKAQLKKRNGKK